MKKGHVLENKVITEIKIAADRKAVLFELSDEKVIAKAYGYCCSSTWVESIEVPALGFPAKVLSIENLDLPDGPQDDEYSVIAYYGLKITTDKGDIVVDYRNESNGYYGGNLSWPDEDYFYGGVFGQNVSKEVWKDITKATGKEE